MNSALQIQLQTLIQWALPVGATIASSLFTFCLLMTRYLKSQCSNGDGRPLRQAVDDLADQFRDHREEMRSDMKMLRDRLTDLETRFHQASQS